MVRKTPANLWTCRRELTRRGFLTRTGIMWTNFALVRMRAKCSKCSYKGTKECSGIVRFRLTEVREVR